MNEKDRKREEIANIIRSKYRFYTEARRYVIEIGYDHYWRFHKEEKKWAELGCPICKAKAKKEIR